MCVSVHRIVAGRVLVRITVVTLGMGEEGSKTTCGSQKDFVLFVSFLP